MREEWIWKPQSTTTTTSLNAATCGDEDGPEEEPDEGPDENDEENAAKGPPETMGLLRANVRAR